MLIERHELEHRIHRHANRLEGRYKPATRLG